MVDTAWWTVSLRDNEIKRPIIHRECREIFAKQGEVESLAPSQKTRQVGSNMEIPRYHESSIVKLIQRKNSIVDQDGVLVDQDGVVPLDQLDQRYQLNCRLLAAVKDTAQKYRCVPESVLNTNFVYDVQIDTCV